MLNVLAACSTAVPDRSVATDPAMELHHSLFTFDLHIDSNFSAWWLGYDLGKYNDTPEGWMPWILQADLPRMVEGGLDSMMLGLVVVGGDQDPVGTIESQLDFAEREVFGRYPHLIELARTAEDFERIHNEGKLAAWFSLEGAHTLGGSLDHLQQWYDRGVRSITMAHFSSNEFAASNADANPDRPGLSELGRRLVCEANRMGIVLDVAHTHPKSLTETVSLSQAPVIVSHTGIASVVPTFRNLKDEHIRMIRDKGGVVGVLFATNWTGENNNATLDDIMDHIDAVRALGGVESLAVGTDYDGVVEVPADLRDVTELPKLTAGLMARGYSEDDLRAMWSGNILRVFRDVERVAAKLQAEASGCD